MEIEAKLIVPDEATFERLLAVPSLGGLALSETVHKRVRDQYLDTPTWAIQAAGYVCRVRHTASRRCILTLKSRVQRQHVVHVREELEQDVPCGDLSRVDEWPAGPAVDLLHRLRADQPLATLFTMHQERMVRLAAAEAGVAPAVEVSLDRVDFNGYGQQLWIEAELLPAGDEAALHRIVQALLDEWGLQPDPWSKFQHGLASAGLA